MGVFYESVPSSLREWILNQKLFWIATAPLSGSGHVNVSPKGAKDFGLIDDCTFYFHDLTGSGNETLAHLNEPGNGRITIMFSAFEGAPKIVRLWGLGHALERGTPEFSHFVEAHDIRILPASRSVIIVDIHQVGSSCGFSVPFYEFKEFRPTLDKHFEKLDERYQASGKIEDSMEHYWAYKNAWSMDNLPGMQRAVSHAKKYKVAPIKKMVGPLAPTSYQSGSGVSVQHVVMMVLASFLLGLLAAMYIPTLLGDRLKDGSLDFRLMNRTDLPSFGNLNVLWTSR